MVQSIACGIGNSGEALSRTGADCFWRHRPRHRLRLFALHRKGTCILDTYVLIAIGITVHRQALSAVSQNAGALQGQLFAIRHLLILREELVRFRMDFSLTEKDLDFHHMRDHMRRVLSGAFR